MQTVYRLLRNNRESGPFTIDELWQQELRPSDLIWAEGISHSWTPIHDMQLIPFEEESPVSTETSQHEPVAPPPRTISLEEKAEEIRLRTLAFVPENDYSHHAKDPVGAYVPADNIDFIDHRKDKPSRLAEVLAAAMVTVFIIAGVAGGKYFIREKKEPVNSVTTQIVAGESNAAKQTISRSPEPPVAAATVLPDSLVATAAVRKTVATSVRKKDTTARIKRLVLEENTAAPQEKKEETTTETADLPAVPVAAAQKKEIVADPPKTTAEEEKKKSLGESLKGLFRKKKKDE